MAAKSAQDNRFRPQMPSIPGVPTNTGGIGSFFRSIPRAGAAVLAALLLLGGLAWAARHHSRPSAISQPTELIAQQDAPSALAAPPPDAPAPSDAGEIAPLAELSKPWSSKAFTFVRPLTHENVPAMVVRLPGGSVGSSGSYWAFSLTEPFGTCQLLYVTNLAVLASQYGYTAQHPMVVDPCTQTVFDPLHEGQRSDGAWVRGEIVQGGGLRPPMAIEVNVRGDALYAARIE